MGGKLFPAVTSGADTGGFPADRRRSLRKSWSRDEGGTLRASREATKEVGSGVIHEGIGPKGIQLLLKA